MSDFFLKNFLKKNAAVIITGGSSGIGKCFIERLLNLEDEFPICNISRSKPELKIGADSVTHIPLDLSKSIPEEETLTAVNKFLDSVERSGEITLINNSGVGAYGKFQEIDVNRQLQMIQLNVCAVVHLTSLFLPLLQKRGGTVINIASTASFQPTPQLTTYGATKSFLLNWSLALGEDLRRTKVRTLCVCPGPTSTNFFRAAGFEESPLPDSIGQTSDQVVDSTMKAWSKGTRFVVSGWSNKVLTTLSACMPRGLVTTLSGMLLRKVRQQ